VKEVRNGNQAKNGYNQAAGYDRKQLELFDFWHAVAFVATARRATPTPLGALAYIPLTSDFHIFNPHLKWLTLAIRRERDDPAARELE
jgi:hypothetical protein